MSKFDRTQNQNRLNKLHNLSHLIVFMHPPPIGMKQQGCPRASVCIYFSSSCHRMNTDI